MRGKKLKRAGCHRSAGGNGAIHLGNHKKNSGLFLCLATAENEDGKWSESEKFKS